MNQRNKIFQTDGDRGRIRRSHRCVWFISSLVDRRTGCGLWRDRSRAAMRVRAFSVARFLACAAVLVTVFVTSLVSGDELTLQRGGQRHALVGEVLVEAQDRSLLFLENDGRLWVVQPDEILDRVDAEEPVEPIDRDELGERLLAELPEGFRLHTNGKFVIAYQTERAYARWIGGLYQRLSRGFDRYWSRKRFKLNAPEFPLPIIIFANKSEYERYLTRELGGAPGEMVAYYNLLTNRVAMYDLTDGQRAPGAELGNERRINEVLSNPRAIPMVATIIHEGTHQLMFNMGMQQRFADTPLWLNEGLAMYFETPDLSNSRGWRAIGQINPLRIQRFRRNLAARTPKSLSNLLSSDEAFRDPTTSLDAYAEAWAFVYFLLNRHEKEFVEYLKHMSAKPLLQYDDGATRVAEFMHFFDVSLDELDREFVEYMRDAR